MERMRSALILLVAVLAMAIVVLFAASHLHAAPRYVVKCSPHLAKASLDTLARMMGIREHGGHNRGHEIDILLGHVGLREPNPWCAATQVTALDSARGSEPLPIARTGLANGIFNDAMKRGRLVAQNVVLPGDLFVYRIPGTSSGHIVRAHKVLWPWMWTYEGNTSSGSRGSQREGTGSYPRIRRIDEPLGNDRPRGAIGLGS